METADVVPLLDLSKPEAHKFYHIVRGITDIRNIYHRISVKKLRTLQFF